MINDLALSINPTDEFRCTGAHERCVLGSEDASWSQYLGRSCVLAGADKVKLAKAASELASWLASARTRTRTSSTDSARRGREREREELGSGRALNNL